jgi:hypothetical protein
MVVPREKLFVVEPDHTEFVLKYLTNKDFIRVADVIRYKCNPDHIELVKINEKAYHKHRNWVYIFIAVKGNRYVIIKIGETMECLLTKTRGHGCDKYEYYSREYTINGKRYNAGRLGAYSSGTGTDQTVREVCQEFLDEGYEVKVIAKKLHCGRCSKTGKKMYEYSKDVEVKLLEDFHNIYRSKPKGNKRNS